MNMRWMAATVVVTTLGVAACGDDRSEVASGGNLERYCELQRELDTEGDVQPEPQSEEEAVALIERAFGDERVDNLAAAAPPEIRDEVRTVAQAYREVGAAGSFEPAESVADQEAAMHAFNEDRCGIPNPLEEE